jgi:hypothetical protein
MCNVYYVRIVSAESFDFLLETKPCVLHKLRVASVPKVAMPLNGPPSWIADGFDHVLVQHFTIDRRELLMPVDNLRGSTSGRTHDQYSTYSQYLSALVGVWNLSTFN